MSVAEVLDRMVTMLPCSFSQECRYWIRASSGQVSAQSSVSKVIGDAGQKALHTALAYERLVLAVVNDQDTGKLEYADEKTFGNAMKKVYPKLKTGHDFTMSLVPVRASCPSFLSCLSNYFSTCNAERTISTENQGPLRRRRCRRQRGESSR